MTAKKSAVNFRNLAVAANGDAAHVRRHRFPHLVGQDKARFILHAKIAGEGELGLALYLIAEDGDGGEVGPEWHLVEGKQRAAGDAEIALAVLAAPPGRAGRAPAVIDGEGAAMRTDGLAFRLRPANLPERGFRLGVGHPHDLSEAEGTSCRR